MSTETESALIERASPLFGGYPFASDAYDELASEPGVPRPHWQTLASAFEKLGREELAARWENGRRIIREHGVTYNVYGDPQGMDRQWELDLVPLVIPPEEWRRIESGLKQRATLFNMLLADIYGPQRLLREGFLPPALVFGNPGFLRPCHGIPVPGGVYLHLQAVDLARSPDGRWWVLADRTQAPSGAGYALENRIVLSRILPDEFRDCQVQRLASFFRLQQDTLRALAPGGKESPNVVLLTPGPHNETFFEQAYLARYLGFPLVEGADLTVRDRRVFIKTLEGLQQVDVILRRVDDTFCDPLELRGDSFLGVAGLVEAARAGNVTIANALGSGLLESPAFLAFLPSLCRHLLGEELELPSVATWWCGQAKEQEYVIENLDDMVVKRTFNSGSRPPAFGQRLSAKEKAALAEAIRARPYQFVGQERVPLSRAPVWLNNRLEPRPVVLRAYVAAAADSFTVMPGALTRVSTSAEDPIVSMQSGGGSKDTWVQTDGPVHPVSLLTPGGQPVSAARVSAELPSRVADNFFWLGRYAERLEGTLRLIRLVLIRLADESGGEGSPELVAMAQTLSGLKLLPERFAGRFTLRELTLEILQLTYNPNRVGSVRDLVLRMRNNASILRDRFSSDTWRILIQLQLDSRTRPGKIPVANALTQLDKLIIDLAAFSGMEMENMTRGHGWRFLDFGRRLERGLSLASWLHASLGPDIALDAILEPILQMADSSMTYRRRYFAQAQLATVLDLLLLDERNPRSLVFQLNALAEHGGQLPRDPASTVGEIEQTRLSALLRELQSADLESLALLRQAGKAEPICGWLWEMVLDLEAVSNDLAHHFFSHTPASVS